MNENDKSKGDFKSIEIANNKSMNKEFSKDSSGQISLFESKKKPAYKNSTNDKISKGYLLEYRLKRLIFFMGYFPQIGVLLRTSQDEQSDVITDLDVYGHYIHKNFARKTIWADCKSGQAKPLERISWIAGVKSLAEIDDVIFIKKGVRSSTVQFARKSGIQILDLDILEKLEHDFGINPNDWRGSWNYNLQMNKLIVFQRISIPNGETYKKISAYIASNYWTFDSFTQVKKTITALKQLAEIEQFPLQEDQLESTKWAIFVLISLFVLSTLNISREIYYFSDEDKKATIIDGLISGEISTKKRAEIIEATYKVAYSLVKSQVPDYNLPFEQVPSIGLVPPKYADAYYDLVLRITNDPLKYYDILRFLDFVLMEYDLQHKKVNLEELKAIFPNYDELIISAKTVIHFICSITGLRRDLFDFLK